MKIEKGIFGLRQKMYGVYKYDGTNFTIYTTENGLTSNLVLSIFEDNKGQLWFGTWQGICIYDGEKFVNASKIKNLGRIKKTARWQPRIIN
jgi:ligand-binding sensor domain-containing protein